MPQKKTSKAAKACKETKTSNEQNLTNNANSKIVDTFKRVKKTTTQKPSRNKSEKDSKHDVNESDLLSMQAILKEFDLNYDYGPIIGIFRTDRLIRAEYFDLAVSKDVKKILENRNLLEKYPDLNLNIWHNIESLL